MLLRPFWKDVQNLLRKQGKKQDFFPLNSLTIIKVVNKELQGKPAAVWHLSWVLSYSLPPLQSTEATFCCFPLVTYNEFPLFCLYLRVLGFWEWKKSAYLLQPEFGISIGYRGQAIHTAPQRDKAGTCLVCYSYPMEQRPHFISVQSHLWQDTWVALNTGTKVALRADKQLLSPQLWFSLAAHASRNNYYFWFCCGWTTCFR